MVTKAAKLIAFRDAELMRERILDALERLIVREGLPAVGINAIAREAGCDKVLIYRYFEDIEGLYAVFAARSAFWWTLEEMIVAIDPKRVSLADALKLILRRHAGAIRKRPITLAVLAAELVERTPLVVALETVREERSLALSAWLTANYRMPDDIDLGVLTMLFGVAVNYLAVRARKIRVMSGIPIKTDQDWERVFRAQDVLIDRILG